MESQKIAKLLLVDDQTLYREGLAGLIRHWPEFEVIGDVTDGPAAIDFCKKRRPDLVLMDVQMPGMSGIEATRAIHEACPDTLIVIHTVSNDEDTLYEAFCAGAQGYALKDMSSSLLRSQLQAVLNGDMVVSGQMTEKLVKLFLATPRPHRNEARSGEQLDDREKELLRLVAQGLSNEEIAAQMYISFGAVKKNLQSLMQKLSLPNRVLLAGYAIRSGLAD